MKALQRPGRVATVIGAVAAVSAATIGVVVGTASAAEPAKCVDNVNVREEPRIDSRVVALCEAGTTVEAGEIRNGFVRLTDLGGWSSQEFISINGQKPVKPTTGGTGTGGTGTGASPRSGTADEDEGTGTSPRSGRSGGTASDDPEGTGARSGGTATEEGTGTRSNRTGNRTDNSTTGEADDPRAGDRSESRTNGRSDAGATDDAEEKAPAKPASPVPALPLPGM